MNFARTLTSLFATLFLFCPPSYAASGTSSDDPTHIKIGSGAEDGSYSVFADSLKKHLTSSQNIPVKKYSTGGSITNIKALLSGEFNISFAQADVAHDAYQNKNLFSHQPNGKSIRSLARLYPEYLYIVVPANSNIKTIRDLKGKHVALGSAGSGTLNTSIAILNTHSVSELSVKGHYTRISQTIENFKDGKIDAFFYISSSPSKILSSLNSDKPIRLLSIKSTMMNKFLTKNPTFRDAEISINPKKSTINAKTVSISAQVFVNENMTETLAYDLTKEIWDVKEDHAIISPLSKSLAISQLAAPLHPGAERYYKEHKILRG